MTGTAEWVGSPPLSSDREAACQYDGDGQMVGPCDPFSPKLTFDGHNTSGTMLGWHFFHGPGLDDPLLGYYRGAAGPKLFFWVTDGQGREFAVADSFATRQSTDDINDIGAWRYAGGTRSGASFDADRFSSTTAPKLSFFRNRAYDQNTGRWLQEDPIGVAGGLNLYQFNGNNPVAYTDPFGLCPEASRDRGGRCPGGLSVKEWNQVKASYRHMTAGAANRVDAKLEGGSITGYDGPRNERGKVTANEPGVIQINRTASGGFLGLRTESVFDKDKQLPKTMMHEDKHTQQIEGLLPGTAVWFYVESNKEALEADARQYAEQNYVP